MFLTSHAFLRVRSIACTDGHEWCFDPLRPYLPRAEGVITVLWTLLFFVSALTFAIRMPEIADVVGDPQLAKPRAAVAFAFFATLGWACSAVAAWRRPRAPVRYRAVATTTAAL